MKKNGLSKSLTKQKEKAPKLIHFRALASAGGFEPSTYSLEGCCSIQLSYAPKLEKFGAGEGNRTLTISLEG